MSLSGDEIISTVQTRASFITSSNISELAVNQRGIAADVVEVLNSSSNPRDHSVQAFAEGGVEKIGRKLCPLAATLTCVNELQRHTTEIGVAEIVKVLIENHGSDDFVPLDEDLQALSTWPEKAKWQAFAANGDIRYQAMSSVVEGLGLNSLVVEGMSVKDFDLFLRSGGVAAISVDNKFYSDITEQNLDTALLPSGHVISILGIKYSETGDYLEDEVYVYDPFSTPEAQKILQISIEQLKKYAKSSSKEGIFGILIAKDKAIVDRESEFRAQGVVRSGRVVGEIAKMAN